MNGKSSEPRTWMTGLFEIEGVLMAPQWVAFVDLPYKTSGRLLLDCDGRARSPWTEIARCGFVPVTLGDLVVRVRRTGKRYQGQIYRVSRIAPTDEHRAVAMAIQVASFDSERATAEIWKGGRDDDALLDLAA